MLYNDFEIPFYLPIIIIIIYMYVIIICQKYNIISGFFKLLGVDVDDDGETFFVFHQLLKNYKFLF